MPLPTPRRLKASSSSSRAPTSSSPWRGSRGTSQLFCGGSDFPVYEIDLDQAKPEAKELGRHDSYVTGLALAGATLVSGGYDGRLIWWDVESRSKVREVDAHRKWIRARGGRARRHCRRQRGRRHGLPALGGRERPDDPRAARPRGADAEPLPLDALRLRDLARRPPSGDRRQGRPRQRLGPRIRSAAGRARGAGLYTWDPVQRRHSIGGIRSLAFSPDGAAAGRRRHRQDLQHRSPGRQGPGRSLRLASRASGTHEFVSDKFKGMVEYLGFHPAGDWLLAAGGGDKDGFLIFFDPAGKKVLAQEKVPMYVHDVALNETGNTIYAVGHRKIAVLGIPQKGTE